MRRQSRVFATLLLAMVMSLTACANPPASPTPTTTPSGTTTPTPRVSPTATSAPADTPQYGGILKVTDAVPRSLTPEINVLKNYFLKVNFDTLLRLDEKGELQSNLATDWKLSPDSKSLTLTLRKGVKFHDGTDFNAAAAKYNLELRKAARVGDFDEVSSFDVIDDYTIRLNISKFSNKLFIPLWFIGGMQNSPTAYQKLGKDTATFNPVGTGPFKFVKYEIGVVIKYERFDAYWQKGKPYLDGHDTYPIIDLTTRELAFRNGEFQVAGVEAKSLADLEKNGFVVGKFPMETFTVLTGDTANPDSPWANKKVREAAEYAIDRQAIAKSLGYSIMEAMYQMAPSGHYAYIPDLKGREYNPAKAKQLLTEAGYPNGFKTRYILRNPITDVNIAIQTYLKEVGIDIAIDFADVARYNLSSTEGWKNGLMDRAQRLAPDWVAQYNTQFAAGAREFVSATKPVEHQKLLDEALAAPDMASKAAAAQRLNKYLVDEAMHLPIYGNLTILLRTKNVHNLEYYAPWGPNKLWSPADVWLSK